jgi:hypothetical protein
VGCGGMSRAGGGASAAGAVNDSLPGIEERAAVFESLPMIKATSRPYRDRNKRLVQMQTAISAAFQFVTSLSF